MILILSLLDYYKYRAKEHGILYLFKLTSSYYPRFMSFGFYDHNKDIIVVAKMPGLKLRIAHERGHQSGFKHIWKLGFVMWPFMIGRGEK